MDELIISSFECFLESEGLLAEINEAAVKIIVGRHVARIIKCLNAYKKKKDYEKK